MRGVAIWRGGVLSLPPLRGKVRMGVELSPPSPNENGEAERHPLTHPIPLRAVIFDAYGTLFREDHVLHLDVFQRMVDLLNIPLSAEAFRAEWLANDRAFRRRRVVLTPEGAHADAFQSYRHAWTENVAKILAAHAAPGDPAATADLMAQALAANAPYPETPDVVRAVAACVPIAILSNADPDYFAKTLQDSGLAFHAIVLSGNEQIYKPHPRIFHRGAELLLCHPQEALFVGNSPEEDVRGAALAGMPTIWINRYGNPWPLPDLTPAYQLPDLLGVPNIVRAHAAID